MIVQYNKFEFNEAQYGPYPAKVSADRVTDETAAGDGARRRTIRCFTQPNQITPRTWEDWVQERGLYFLGERDPQYVDLARARRIRSRYNAGAKRGALVEAPVGKGRWVYVGLGLWRQLPAGTDGAYQLLANLLVARRGRQDDELAMSAATPDVLVVGAGPAGATAARTLAAAGARVRLLDRARFPRNKPCGGAISMRVLGRFPYLAAALDRIPTHRISRLHLESPGGDSLLVRSPSPAALMIRRLSSTRCWCASRSRLASRWSKAPRSPRRARPITVWS